MIHFTLRHQFSSQEHLSTSSSHDEAGEFVENEIESLDFSSMSKADLLVEIKKLQNGSPQESYSIAKKIKSVADEIHSSEEADALNRYLEDGGDKESFEYRDSDFEQIAECYKKVKDQFVNFSNEQKSQREHNLKTKEALLDTLREIVNQEETNDSHQKVKKIQEEWKAIGQVPSEKAQDLYGNYSALLNRYYDQQSIYYQFKELDRKKNLEAKTKICEKAEELLKTESVGAALKELSELHSEYKSLGPVPKEHQEELWNRLKAASELLYQKRKVYQEGLESQYAENLRLKEALLKEIDEFSNFTSPKAELWQKKTNEVIALKEKWGKIGFVTKERSKDVNKLFWALYKKFFHNKGDYFKVLHDERQRNLALKLQLLDQVNQILEVGEVNDKSIDEIKGLQRKWKEVGPTFFKKGNEVYEKFKVSCDKFFDLKRGNEADKDKVFEENYKNKLSYCDSIEKETQLLQFEDVLSKWESYGLVPRKEIGNAKSRLLKSWELHVDNLVKDPESNHKQKLKAQVVLLKDSPDGKNKLFQKEKSIKSKIITLENDIATLTNNLEFFAKSKNADLMKSDVLKKIDLAKKELDKLKQEYKLFKAL